MTIPFDPRRPPPDALSPEPPVDGASLAEAPFAFPGGDAVDAAQFEQAAREALGLAQPAPLAVPGVNAPDDTADATPLAEPEAEPPVDPAQAEAEQAERRTRAIAALYGSDCPLLQDTPDDNAWTRWASSLWDRHRAAMQPMLQTAARNRLFRQGKQWIALRGETWREPPKAMDEARLVHNMIRPALALRQQVVSEQRPGFRVEPTQQTPDAQKSAEAQQKALEVQYDQQRMEPVIREAAHWAGTDGVSFLHLWWDPDRGPEDEAQQGEPLGDLATSVFRIEQVRVSANATASEKPWYWVVRTVLSLAEAVARYGPDVAKSRAADAQAGLGVAVDALGLPTGGGQTTTAERRGVPPTQLLTDQETVDHYLVYCEPIPGALPKGLMLSVCGDALVHQGDLPWGVVPLVRFTDGSEDPAFYPDAVMNDWVDHQRRINALVSKVVENIRVNAHGRLLSRPGAIKPETLIGGTLGVIEVQAGVAMAEAAVPFPAMSIAADVKEQLAFEMQAFEQKSGWNDATRGSFGSGESGRSILAQRETVERIFTPPVGAAAEAMTRWGEIAMHGMRWGYDLPRWIGTTGGDRPDLGLSISSDDFKGVGTVRIDPETLMPLPRSMRLFQLQQDLDKGVIDVDEYRRRAPQAYVGDYATPKRHKEARARRFALAIQTDQPLPDVRWTDDPAVMQSVLEEEILDVDKPTDPEWAQKVQTATQVWQAYAQLAGMQGGTLPPGDLPTPGGGPGGDPAGLPPGAQPFPGTNPGVAAAPAGVMTAESDEDAARAADGLLGL